MKSFVMRHWSIFYAVFFVAVLFCSCASTGSSSWSMPGEKIVGRVWISSVIADKPAGWMSIEKEVTDILPLLLLQNKYIVAKSQEEADIFIEVRIREREYVLGWNMERSLSVEVYFKSGNSDNANIVSAGRVMSRGMKSFASSNVLNNMLEKALRKAIRGLPNEF